MGNLKLNKQVEASDFDVIPDAPSMDEIAAVPTMEENASENIGQNEPLVKKQEVAQRKLFSNKKANIAFIIAGAVIGIAIIAALVFAYVI